MAAYISCSRCDLRIGDVIDHKYVVEKPLGEGSFGQVFRVHDTASNALYALKLLKLWTVESVERDRLCKRFVQEYETGRIQSSYLVQSIDHGTLQGNPYIVMEYCQHGDLSHAIDSNKVDIAVAAHEILLGLKALHTNGKVHRDLKPENVLLKSNGVAALTDFGISGDRNKRLTERNTFGIPKEMFGTFAYMPPEQVNPKRGDATVLPTTDIFSFGVMMYQLITATLPFGPLEDEKDLYQYITNGKNGNWDRQSLQRTPHGGEWETLIARCLEPNFRQRLQTTDEVIELLPRRSHTANHVENSVAEDIYTVRQGYALRIMQGEEYGQVYRLNALMNNLGRRILTMGRHAEGVNNTINIRETESCYISRKHCTLEYNVQYNKWLLRDGQWDMHATNAWHLSLNGTYVDSTELDKNGIYLQPGNIISIGDVKLRVEGY